MKQYTSKDQTTKLIEYGFPRPKFSFPIEDNEHPDYVDEEGIPWSLVESYSIGELIEFLPKEITDEYEEVTSLEFSKTEVYYTNLRFMSYYKNSAELIDALFNMCKTLKEEGVI